MTDAQESLMKSGASNYVNGYFSGYSEIWKSLASVGIQGFSVGAEGGIRTPARFYPDRKSVV